MSDQDMLSRYHFLMRSLAVLCTFVSVQQALASHILGADISYTCLGGTSYEVTLNLYRECGGASLTPAEFQLEFDSDCGTVPDTVPDLVPIAREVSQLCPSSLFNSGCSGGVQPGVEHYQFKTTVTLPACQAWRISWSSSSSRPAAVNALNAGIYVEAVLNSTTVPCNNSLVLNEEGIPFVCVGQPIFYNFGVLEPDGDSLVYTLVDAQFAAPIPTSIPYKDDFSGVDPFPVVALDPNTGQLNFMTSMTGNYVVAVLVEEYNAIGDLIGSVIRDMTVPVLPCTGNVPNAMAISNNTEGTMTGDNSIAVCHDEMFCVDMVFTDPDVTDILTVTAAGLPPGGALTMVIGTNPSTTIATFCWTADSTESPLNVILTATDGFCPIENIAQAVIHVTVLANGEPPDAGESASILLCRVSGSVNLLDSLRGTPDSGGTWTSPNGISHSGMLDLLNDQDGPYTYTVSGMCGAADASAVVSVSIGGAPNPGISDTDLNVCDTGGPINLITGLSNSPDPGGAWTDFSGMDHSGMLDPQTDIAGDYTYTVTGIAPCADTSSVVTVTIIAAPYAGTDTEVNLCADSPEVNLIETLGDITDLDDGLWVDPTGLLTDGIFTPGTDDPGDYTYNVAGTPPCSGARTTVTVRVTDDVADPGRSKVLTFCDVFPVTNLMDSLGGNPDPGGTWVDPNDMPHSGVLDPQIDIAGDYTYNITGTALCADTSSTVTVTIIAAPDAGEDAVIDHCSSDGVVDLFTQLGGTPDVGGIWEGPSIISAGMFDPSRHTVGVYTYRVSSEFPCVAVSAQVTVNVNNLVAGFNAIPPVVALSNTTVFFESMASGFNDHYWVFSGLDTSDVFAPSFTFPSERPGSYEVCQHVSIDPTCFDSTCINIEVKEGSRIFVPNAFSPDGDRLNDLFQPIVCGISAESYEFRVFNRWGELLFFSQQLGEAWDGTVNGSDYQGGVCVWEVVVQDIFNGEMVQKAGHVTLVR